MTSDEARQRVNECEHQIVIEYSKLKDSARVVGSSAASSASSHTMKSTLLPLILCIFGFFCFKGPWFLGVLLIGLGIFLAYRLHDDAHGRQNIIENGQKNLNSIIDNNADI